MKLTRYRTYLTSLSISIIICLLLSAIPAQAATIQLPKGTDITAKFVPGMKISSGNLTEGIPIIFTLAEPIQIGGKTIVEAGAQGTANVVEVKKSGRGGKPGFIKIDFVDLEPKGDYHTAGDAKIKLTGSAENKGKGKKTLSYLFIFGLFIKGGQGELPADSTYTAQVAESVILESN